MKYESVIGLEIHVQLSTLSKVFCGCSTKFGKEPNTLICPVCLGLPGVLPVLNQKALEYTVKTGLALNCEISSYSKFDRKTYFYPDLPKNFQISQYDMPIAMNGYLVITNREFQKRIEIIRVHLEEDAGKLVHISKNGRIEESEESLVDFNRTGIPLMEIVTAPDINSTDEAYEFLTALKNILMYLDVSDCNMEEGSLRCDANISIRPEGTKELGVKVEVKNMNSFKNLKDALEYEIERQINILESGEKIERETMLWDADSKITMPMRSKEQAHDYRYFPEPDLTPIVIDKLFIEEIRKTLPELPVERKERFIRKYKIPEYDAEVLTSSRDLADYYEECTMIYDNFKAISNWVMVDLLGFLKACNLEIKESNVKPSELVNLLKLRDDRTISGKIAKQVFEDMFKTGKSASDIIREKNLVQITDEGELNKIIEKVLSENQKSVSDYKIGKEKAFTFLIGQIMKMTGGKANPQIINKILKEKLPGDR